VDSGAQTARPAFTGGALCRPAQRPDSDSVEVPASHALRGWRRNLEAILCEHERGDGRQAGAAERADAPWGVHCGSATFCHSGTLLVPAAASWCDSCAMLTVLPRG
jgi:hypothetical protein